MAFAEGGIGGGGGGGGFLAIPSIVRAFDRWFNKPVKPGRSPTSQESREARARVYGYPSAAALEAAIPVFQRSLPARGVLSATQPGPAASRGQPPPGVVEQVLDAATRGVQRGLELRDLLELLLSLFRKPPRVSYDFFNLGDFMPYLTLPSPGIGGLSGSGFDFGGIGTGIAAIVNAFRGGRSMTMPGGAAFGQPAQQAGIFGDILSGRGILGIGAGGSSDCPTLWRESGATRATPLRRIIRQNPVTGNLAVWEYAGHPILMSRDFAVAKRFSRITGRPRPRRVGRARRRRFR